MEYRKGMQSAELSPRKSDSDIGYVVDEFGDRRESDAIKTKAIATDYIQGLLKF